MLERNKRLMCRPNWGAVVHTVQGGPQPAAMVTKELQLWPHRPEPVSGSGKAERVSVLGIRSRPGGAVHAMFMKVSTRRGHDVVHGQSWASLLMCIPWSGLKNATVSQAWALAPHGACLGSEGLGAMRTRVIGRHQGTRRLSVARSPIAGERKT